MSETPEPTICLSLEVPDTMGSGVMWNLYSVEFKVPDRAMEQSLYIYARSHKEARERVAMVAKNITDVRQLHGQTSV